MIPLPTPLRPFSGSHAGTLVAPLQGATGGVAFPGALPQAIAFEPFRLTGALLIGAHPPKFMMSQYISQSRPPYGELYFRHTRYSTISRGAPGKPCTSYSLSVVRFPFFIRFFPLSLPPIPSGLRCAGKPGPANGPPSTGTSAPRQLPWDRIAAFPRPSPRTSRPRC